MAVLPRSQEKQLPPAALNFASDLVATAGVLDEETGAILAHAFATVPREVFLESGLSRYAYSDVAVPVGFGQLQPKPSVVARMLSLVGISKGMRVLEVGAGSGYCSAIMAACGVQVYAKEVIGLLAQVARKKLDALSFQTVLIRNGDGLTGWAEHAPYDAIVVSTPIASIDPKLLDQLVKPKGRLVAPLGDEYTQTLVLVEAKRDSFATYELEQCNFYDRQ